MLTSRVRFPAFLILIGLLTIAPADLSAQIWGLANKTHRSTQITPVVNKVIFSVSNHLFFSPNLGQVLTVDGGSSSNGVSGFSVGSAGVFYFSSPEGLFSTPAFTDMNNENWVRIDSVNIPAITALFVRASADAAGTDDIFVGTGSGLWRRNSNEDTWKKIHDAGDGAPILQITAFNKNIYYRTLGTAFASHDAGATWTDIASFVTAERTAIVATSDTDLYIAVSGNPGSLVLHSTDGGNSFNGPRGINFSARTIRSMAEAGNGDLYFGGGVRSQFNLDSITQGFVYRFLKDGTAWEDYSVGLPIGLPSSEVIGLGFGSGGNVFAGTDSAGLWRTLLPSGVSEATSIHGITLSQNFPNPAKKYTGFSVSNDHAIKASLGVYDAAGRNILRIFDGELAPGSHSFSIGTESLANGTYFYRLQSPEVSTGRVFVVIK
jgi:hypothetical protein